MQDLWRLVPPFDWCHHKSTQVNLRWLAFSFDQGLTIYFLLTFSICVRKKDIRHYLHINLSLAIAVAQLIFIFGITKTEYKVTELKNNMYHAIIELWRHNRFFFLTYSGPLQGFSSWPSLFLPSCIFSNAMWRCPPCHLGRSSTYAWWFQTASVSDHKLG